MFSTSEYSPPEARVMNSDNYHFGSRFKKQRQQMDKKTALGRRVTSEGYQEYLGDIMNHLRQLIEKIVGSEEVIFKIFVLFFCVF